MTSRLLSSLFHPDSPTITILVACFVPQVQTQTPNPYLHFPHSTETQKLYLAAHGVAFDYNRQSRSSRQRRAEGGEETAVSNHGSTVSPWKTSRNVHVSIGEDTDVPQLFWESSFCAEIRVETAAVISSQWMNNQLWCALVVLEAAGEFLPSPTFAEGARSADAF